MNQLNKSSIIKDKRKAITPIVKEEPRVQVKQKKITDYNFETGIPHFGNYFFNRIL